MLTKHYFCGLCFNTANDSERTGAQDLMPCSAAEANANKQLHALPTQPQLKNHRKR